SRVSLLAVSRGPTKIQEGPSAEVVAETRWWLLAENEIREWRLVLGNSRSLVWMTLEVVAIDTNRNAVVPFAAQISIFFLALEPTGSWKDD
ncbi:hypothetical protein L195_g057681, partial [Trifolium pratense]